MSCYDGQEDKILYCRKRKKSEQQSPVMMPMSDSQCQTLFQEVLETAGGGGRGGVGPRQGDSQMSVDRCSFLEQCVVQLSRLCDGLVHRLGYLDGEINAKVRCFTEQLEASSKTLASCKGQLGSDRARAEESTARRDKKEAVMAKRYQRLERSNRELNVELSQVIRENDHLKQTLERLTRDLHELKTGEVRKKTKGSATGSYTDPVQRKRSRTEKSRSKQTEKAMNGGKERFKSFFVTEPAADDDFSFSEGSSFTLERSSSYESSDSESSTSKAADSRTTIRALRDELTEVKRKHIRLVQDVVDRDSDLAKAQEQMTEIQKELYDNREECYGHMKVIQQLKENQKEQERQNKIRSEQTAQKAKKICNLQFELVESKRELSRVMKRLEGLRQEHYRFLKEYDLLRDNFAFIVSKYEARGKPSPEILADSKLPDLEEKTATAEKKKAVTTTTKTKKQKSSSAVKQTKALQCK